MPRRSMSSPFSHPFGRVLKSSLSIFFFVSTAIFGPKETFMSSFTGPKQKHLAIFLPGLQPAKHVLHQAAEALELGDRCCAAKSFFTIGRVLLSLLISEPSIVRSFGVACDVWNGKGPGFKCSRSALYARTSPRTTPSYLDVWRLQHAADDYSIQLDHDEDCRNRYIPAIF
jgi:hypothetical protein